MRRNWTTEEDDTIRQLCGSMTAAELGARLSRSARAVSNRIEKLGLTRRQKARGPAYEAFVRQKNSEGWCDTEIADAYGCDRHAVSRLRKQLGLPSHARGERFIGRIRSATQRQCAAAGVPTLAALRVKTFHNRARAAGWPDDLAPRAVEILNALWERGPMTRREICAAVGMPWKGSRKSLVCRGPGGSYLAVLMRRGLVQRLQRARVVRGQGKGKSQDVYTLPFGIERRVAQ